MRAVDPLVLPDSEADSALYYGMAPQPNQAIFCGSLAVGFLGLLFSLVESGLEHRSYRPAAGIGMASESDRNDNVEKIPVHLTRVSHSTKGCQVGGSTT